MRAVLRTAALLLCLVVIRSARAAEFTGNGPLAVRNFQPIQLIFLNLPFERAQVLERGAFEIHLESAESNEIATHQEDVQALLKFETNRTVIGGGLCVVAGAAGGAHAPYIPQI